MIKTGVLVIEYKNRLEDAPLHQPILLSGARRMESSEIPKKMIELGVSLGLPLEWMESIYTGKKDGATVQKYSKDQPRHPKGSPKGGQFASTGEVGQQSQEDKDQEFFKTASYNDIADKLFKVGLDMDGVGFAKTENLLFHEPKHIDYSSEDEEYKARSLKLRVLASQLYHEKVYLRDKFGIDIRMHTGMYSNMAPSGQAIVGGDESAFSDWTLSIEAMTNQALSKNSGSLSAEFRTAVKSMPAYKDFGIYHFLDNASREEKVKASQAAIRALIRHEWGHNFTEKKSGNPFDSFGERIWQEVGEARIEKDLGKYAKSSQWELAAEAFSKYTSPYYRKGDMHPALENLAMMLIDNGKKRTQEAEEKRTYKASVYPLKDGYEWERDNTFYEVSDIDLKVRITKTGEVITYRQYLKLYPIPKFDGGSGDVPI